MISSCICNNSGATAFTQHKISHSLNPRITEPWPSENPSAHNTIPQYLTVNRSPSTSPSPYLSAPERTTQHRKLLMSARKQNTPLKTPSQSQAQSIIFTPLIPKKENPQTHTMRCLGIKYTRVRAKANAILSLPLFPRQEILPLASLRTKGSFATIEPITIHDRRREGRFQNPSSDDAPENGLAGIAVCCFTTAQITADRG